MAAPPLAKKPTENRNTVVAPEPARTLAAPTSAVPDTAAPEAAMQTLPLPTSGKISWNTVKVPVFVVLSQGILLGLVGVMAFGMGTWFGRAWERQSRGGAATQTTLLPVKGKCVYRKSGGETWIADEGAVVLFVPVGVHVLQTAPLMGLRPGDDANLSRRGLAQLKEWGGARALCQPDGTYEVALNPNQDYWVLALSAHKRRAATSPVSVADVRKTERFFSLVGDGFGPWEVKTTQKRVVGNDWIEFAF